MALSQDKQAPVAPSRRGFGIPLAAATLVRPALAASAPADLPGWGETRWGMRRDELARVLGPPLKPLAAPLEYGDLIVRETLPDQRIAGRPFVALLQLDRAAERLAQVLVRYRGDFPMLSDFAAVRDTLAQDLGEPHERRAETDYSGTFPSFWIEAAWTFPATEVVVALVDPNARPLSRRRKTLIVRYTPRSAP